MTQTIIIKTWEPLKTFENDYSKLKPNIKDAVDEALRLLLKNPNSKKLRLKSVSGSKNPKIYAIHVTPNHSHKLSFFLDGTKAVLRRIGTHKEIDKNP